VLIKNAEMLEILERIDTIVIDKTGTLTEGHPKLTECLAVDPFSEEELLRLAAAVEKNSEHPLARAIVQGANDRDKPASDQLKLPAVGEFESTTGGGVQGVVDGKKVLVGKMEFLKNEGVKITGRGMQVSAGDSDYDDGAEDRPATGKLAKPLSGLFDKGAELQQQGRTVIYVAVDGELAGFVAVSDPIKATTPEALHALHELGLEVIMLTGDNERTAAAVARELGIDRFEAGVAPQDKHERVKKLHAEGKRVAMAGDGINDAPALAEADVGIAMGTGTQVAIEAAGVTLVKGDLRGIVRAVQLSRRVMRNIRQNLFFAFIYNAAGVPVAAGVLVPFFGFKALLNPMLAAAAMSFSSVSVIANALRLRTTRLL
jgi:Cu+-exporting ATPase